MNINPNRLRLCAYLALVFMMAFASYAMRVDAATGKGYARANFAFAQPARLKASVSGTSAILNFDRPVTQSPASIKAALAGYVSAVSISEDKRSVSLTLTKPYHLRQFVSGTTVGIDLVGAPSAAVAESQPETVITTKKAAPEPAAKLAQSAKEKTVAAKKAKAEKAKALASKTPKAAAPVKPATEATGSIVNPASRDDSILTTKQAAEEKSDNLTAVTAATTKAVEKAAATQQPVLTTKNETPPAPVEDKSDEISPAAEKTADPHAKASETPPGKPVAAPLPVTKLPSFAAPNAKRPFVVGAKATSMGETVINFPFTSRTGTALFRRGHDIWLIFSTAKDTNAGLLSTVLPKQVINVTQYAYGNATVLRLSTDGSVHARAEQVKGTYAWNIILGKTAKPAANDITIAADTLEGTTRLILGAYDLTPTLRFYDPNAGDEFIIAPSMEDGRGVASDHNYAEFSILGSNQGIAIVTNTHELEAKQSRSGFILSSKNGLAISESLPMVESNGSSQSMTKNTATLLPYEQWYVPLSLFRETELSRLHEVATATKSSKADALMEMVKLYLSQGMGVEASGMLDLIAAQYPDYYVANKLALLSTAAHVMAGHMADANRDLQAPEIADLDEAMPWREVVSLFVPPVSNAQPAMQGPQLPNDSVANVTPAATQATAAPTESLEPGATPPAPAPKPVFHFLKYSKLYLRYYPPRIRQRLALIASDAYLADGQEEKALAVFDTLMRDQILQPVRNDAEFVLGKVAEKKGETDDALKTYDRLAKQNADRRIASRARYAAALLRFKKGQLTADQAAEIVENTRLGWHGDVIEHEMLKDLITIYTDAKRYDDVMRSYRALIEGFPADPELLSNAGAMNDLFQRVFLEGLADEMTPLKALSLFYEFREFTPLGAAGDQIVQKLADRLAAIDLLDRATQLLDNQVRFRATGEARSQIGARLALLHLLNQHPQDALDVLEITNYGDNKSALRIQRQQLTAEALSKLKKNDEALGVIANDTTPTGALLRLDILWAMRDWPNVVNHAEDILGARTNLTEPLSTQDTEVLLKLALAYSFEGDLTQLRYLRDYYANLIPNTKYKQIFDFITNDTTPLDPEDFAMLAQQISRTESFLDTFKTKIAAGKLSEAVQ